MPSAAGPLYKGRRLPPTGAPVGVAGAQGQMNVSDEDNLLDTATDFAFAGELHHCTSAKSFYQIDSTLLALAHAKKGEDVLACNRHTGP